MLQPQLLHHMISLRPIVSNARDDSYPSILSTLLERVSENLSELRLIHILCGMDRLLPTGPSHRRQLLIPLQTRPHSRIHCGLTDPGSPRPLNRRTGEMKAAVADGKVR
jgi:hypothetical protein